MTFNNERVEKEWTFGAIECLLRCCNCSMCPTNDIMKSRCMMKYSVVKLVQMLGEPTEDDCRRVGISYAQFKRLRQESQILLE